MTKRVKLSVFNLAGIVLAVLVGAALSAQTNFPSGTFIGTDLPVTFTSTSAATGKMIVKDKRTIVAEAVYTLSGDQIVFTDKEGKAACLDPAVAVGKYRWKYDGQALRFTKVEDRCENRIRILTTLRLSRRK